MRILYTGSFRKGSYTESRRQALHSLGHEVVELDQVPYLYRGSYVLQKTQCHLLIGPGIVAYNHDLVRLARETNPNLIYIDQVVYLWPRSVEALHNGGSRLVHHTSEYFGFRTYLYRHFFKTVHLYDVHVITNSLCRSVLSRKGAKRIVRDEFGFDPRLHKPWRLTDEEKREYQSDATFVGHWELETERMIATLRGAGIAVKVWGPGWRRATSLKDRHSIRPLFGEEYIKQLVASKICLGFLSKWNHNQSASRTFEIPAVGGFLLAERTEDHLSYFTEGKEAEFFSSPEELFQKARYYLTHEDERTSIAEAGHERCLQSGYTHQDRVEQILGKIM